MLERYGVYRVGDASMALKIFITLIVIIAIIAGAMAVYLPRDQIVRLIILRDFFDIALPILAFGALIKYLCTCSSCHHHNKE